ncbi:hypothetical protein BN1723_008092 [Verticillium longisporum]|uniref:BRCT domain-containing protein n=1 Tax=Verticillium longisporum TaxID=100787 RepID=A0A0G4NQA1_VERLO|nr:hypothetical protein BN1723_008092 [Verticillium longisporum]
MAAALTSAWKIIPSLQSTSIEATATFYTDELGFTLASTESDGGEAYFCSVYAGPKAAANIYFFHASPEDCRPGAVMIAVGTAEIDSFYAYLQGRPAVKLVEELEDKPWGYRHQPDENAAVDHEKPFQRVVVCCTSIPPDQRTEIEKKAQDLGGHHKYDLTPDVTHLIVGQYDTPKYRHLAEDGDEVGARLVADAGVLEDLGRHERPPDARRSATRRTANTTGDGFSKSVDLPPPDENDPAPTAQPVLPETVTIQAEDEEEQEGKQEADAHDTSVTTDLVAQKRVREAETAAERAAISSHIASLMNTRSHASEEPTGPEGSDDKPPARRRRGIFGRATSNVSAASSASHESGRPGGRQQAHEDAAQPPPATQVRYDDPEAAQCKAELMRRMLGEEGQPVGKKVVRKRAL